MGEVGDEDLAKLSGLASSLLGGDCLGLLPDLLRGSLGKAFQFGPQVAFSVGPAIVLVAVPGDVEGYFAEARKSQVRDRSSAKWSSMVIAPSV